MHRHRLNTWLWTIHRTHIRLSIQHSKMCKKSNKVSFNKKDFEKSTKFVNDLIKTTKQKMSSNQHLSLSKQCMLRNTMYSLMFFEYTLPDVKKRSKKERSWTYYQSNRRQGEVSGKMILKTVHNSMQSLHVDEKPSLKDRLTISLMRMRSQSIEHLSRIRSQSIDNLSRIRSQSIENLSRIKSQSIENVSRIRSHSIENLSRIRCGAKTNVEE